MHAAGLVRPVVFAIRAIDKAPLLPQDGVLKYQSTRKRIRRKQRP
jgi:hypothetical protein